jgi:hypothetical protein
VEPSSREQKRRARAIAVLGNLLIFLSMVSAGVVVLGMVALVKHWPLYVGIPLLPIGLLGMSYGQMLGFPLRQQGWGDLEELRHLEQRRHLAERVQALERTIDFEAELATPPRTMDAYLDLAMLWADTTGDRSSEIRVLSVAAERHPHNPRFKYELGRARLLHGEIREALTTFDQCLAADPAYARVVDYTLQSVGETIRESYRPKRGRSLGRMGPGTGNGSPPPPADASPVAGRPRRGGR